MSAWIVNKDNIHRVITAIQILIEEGHSSSCDVPLLDRLMLDRNDLGKQLWMMNRDAVKQRYGGPIENLPGNRVTAYRFVRSGVDAYQLIKSLHCFGYQCGEGDVTETDLYKAIREVTGVFESYLVRTDQRYINASWG